MHVGITALVKGVQLHPSQLGNNFWDGLWATSADDIVQLFKMKCLPVLYYGSEACPLNKTATRSLQYVVKSCFSKIFQTRSDDVIAECMDACSTAYLWPMLFRDVEVIFC